MALSAASSKPTPLAPFRGIGHSGPIRAMQSGRWSAPATRKRYAHLLANITGTNFQNEARLDIQNDGAGDDAEIAQGPLDSYLFESQGHVAEWLRNGLQNRVPRFNSGRGLQKYQILIASSGQIAELDQPQGNGCGNGLACPALPRQAPPSRFFRGAATAAPALGITRYKPSYGSAVTRNRWWKVFEDQRGCLPHGFAGCTRAVSAVAALFGAVDRRGPAKYARRSASARLQLVKVLQHESNNSGAACGYEHDGASGRTGVADAGV